MKITILEEILPSYQNLLSQSIHLSFPWALFVPWRTGAPELEPFQPSYPGEFSATFQMHASPLLPCVSEKRETIPNNQVVRSGISAFQW